MNGKVSIITGAGSGIGRASAICLAKEGAKVILTDVQTDKLEAAVEEITAFTSDAIGIKHNVAEEKEWISVIQKVIDRFGTINVLVNSAGINSKADTKEEWDR